MKFRRDDIWSSLWARFEPDDAYDYMRRVILESLPEDAPAGSFDWYPLTNGETLESFELYFETTGTYEAAFETARSYRNAPLEFGVLNNLMPVDDTKFPKLEYVGRRRELGEGGDS